MSEIGEFHHNDGWYFKRLEDGSVRIRIRKTPETEAMFADRVKYIDHLVPALEWASILTAVAKFDDALTYGMATRLHGGDMYDRNFFEGRDRDLDAGPALAATADDAGEVAE